MVLPGDRYAFSKKNRQRPNLKIWLIVIFLLIAVSLTVFFTVRKKDPEELPDPLSVMGIEELWEKKKYDEILTRCTERLGKNPVDPNYLKLQGLAYLYKGSSQFSIEEKLPLIDESVIALRKALIVERSEELRSELKYVLGRAYYHKGSYYADLAVRYLNESLDENYDGLDTYEYLGMAYSSLEDFDATIDAFEKAQERNPSDVLFLSLGRTYYQLNLIPESIAHFRKAIDNTRDFNIRQSSQFFLSKIYIEQEQYALAEEQLLNILNLNDNSAEAHFQLGELYSKMGDKVKAYIEFNRTIKIDPNHIGAKTRLYN